MKFSRKILVPAEEGSGKLDKANDVGTPWKCLESVDGNPLNLKKSWGIFGLGELAWSSSCETMRDKDVSLAD